MRLCINVEAQFRSHIDQLVSDIVCLFKSSKIEEVVPAPVCVHALLNEGIKCVKHCKVVSVLMDKLVFCVVSFCLIIFWP